MDYQNQYLTRFSMLFRNTSRKSCCEQAPDSTILTTRSDLRNTSWYDCTAFWNASSAIIGVSPFRKAMNLDVIVSSWCLLILIWRRVMSVGCLALNGYATHRDTNTYNWMRFLRSSSSRSCRSSPSFFSLTTDGDGDVGRGNELTRDDPLDCWFILSCDILEGDRFLIVFVWGVCVGFVAWNECDRLILIIWKTDGGQERMHKPFATVCTVCLQSLGSVLPQQPIRDSKCDGNETEQETCNTDSPSHFLIRYV